MSIKSIILVSIQIITMDYLLIITNPFNLGFWVVLQVLGISIAVWGILVMKFVNFNIQPEVKSTTLTTKGPYKIIRNPMYIGVILIFAPIIVTNFNLINLLIYITLIFTLLLKIISEEQFLEQRFGYAYLNYKKKTFRLIPFIC